MTVLHLAQAFDLEPSSFGFSDGRPRLVALAKEEADRKTATLLLRSSSFWVVLHAADRARGVQAMKRWIDGRIGDEAKPR
jgi:hypothetical protein